MTDKRKDQHDSATAGSKSARSAKSGHAGKAGDKATAGITARTTAVPVPARPRAVGTTWWGQRWITVLEHGSRDGVTRLGKGRAYARDGHVHGLEIKPGMVRATVTDDELDSHLVTLKLGAFDAKTWQRILQQMSGQALFAAELLNGVMPKDIERVFRSVGKSLFPSDTHEIDADCSCEDWSSPCRHVAATHYVLGEALDHDPFLLFELRGRSKEQVLAALNRLRIEPAAAPAELAAAPSSCALSALQSLPFETSTQALPALSFHFNEPVAGALLRSLGQPRSWVGSSPQELFAPALHHAAQQARDWAIGASPVVLKPLQHDHPVPVRRGRKRSAPPS